MTFPFKLSQFALRASRLLLLCSVNKLDTIPGAKFSQFFQQVFVGGHGRIRPVHRHTGFCEIIVHSTRYDQRNNLRGLVGSVGEMVNASSRNIDIPSGRYLDGMIARRKGDLAFQHVKRFFHRIMKMRRRPTSPPSVTCIKA